MGGTCDLVRWLGKLLEGLLWCVPRETSEHRLKDVTFESQSAVAEGSPSSPRRTGSALPYVRSSCLEIGAALCSEG